MSRLPIRGRIWRYNRKRRGNLGLYGEFEVRRLASKIDRVREWSKGDEDYWRAVINRANALEGRKRDKIDRLRNSLGETEGQRYGIIAELQRFWRDENNFDWSMEDLEVQGGQTGMKSGAVWRV